MKNLWSEKRFLCQILTANNTEPALLLIFASFFFFSFSFHFRFTNFLLGFTCRSPEVLREVLRFTYFQLKSYDRRDLKSVSYPLSDPLSDLVANDLVTISFAGSKEQAKHIVPSLFFEDRVKNRKLGGFDGNTIRNSQ